MATGTGTSKWRQLIVGEKAFAFNLITALFLIFLKKTCFFPPTQNLWLALIFIWLFCAILWGAFAVVRHAESLALLVQEPFGTLILTLSVITIEVMVISSVMIVGDNNTTLARDTMYAVIMILLNGLLGLSLLLGGWRYREQQYNLQGSKAFLSVILLFGVLGLILPNYTQSSQDATLSLFQQIFLIITSITIYSIFLAIQTSRHRPYFMEPTQIHDTYPVEDIQPVAQFSILSHSILLILNLVPIIILSKFIAFPISDAMARLHAPSALGGLAVAILVLSPEAMSAIRASLANQLQRSVNILLGSALATIILTIPAVLIVGILTHKSVIIGLNPLNTLMLLLTFFISLITFGSGRTNVLQGAIHLLLFLVYIVLIFD